MFSHRRRLVSVAHIILSAMKESSGLYLPLSMWHSAAMANAKRKDPHAVALGRKGGVARKRNLTAEQRSEIARKAVQARWKKAKKAE